MNKALLGRYWPSNSVIHSLDARTKITITFVMVIVILLLQNWWALGVSAICVFAFFVASRISPLEALRSILPLLFIIVLSAAFNIFYVSSGEVLADYGWLKITSGGVESAAFLSARLALLLLIGSLLTMTTTTFDIAFGIEAMLSPLTKIKVPVHEFAFVISTALSFLPQIASEYESVRVAQEARGAKLATTPLKGLRAISSLIVPMFASIFRHADTLALAMDARCFVPGAERTKLYPMLFRKQDYIAFAITALICVAVTLTWFL